MTRPIVFGSVVWYRSSTPGGWRYRVLCVWGDRVRVRWFRLDLLMGRRHMHSAPEYHALADLVRV